MIPSAALEDLYLTTASQEMLFAWALQKIHQSGMNNKVITCRGESMTTTKDMYREISAAWQFPYYFGWNAAAVVDCLSDLAWMPAESYFFVIYDANVLLSRENSKEIAGLFRDFLEISRRWREDMAGVISSRQPLKFCVVLQVPVESPLPYQDQLAVLPRSVATLDMIA